jgi:Gas vesicle synthesis protein GvpL/GvpF
VKSRAAASENKANPSRVLYLYAISRLPKVAVKISAEAIDGTPSVEGLRCGSFLCWISRVAKIEFADELPERMQDLEWLATTGLRHQRTVAEIAKHLTILPARFGTVFLSEDSLIQHIRERKGAVEQAFERVADADEWGIKIFAAPRQLARSLPKAASGSDYLKHKAELLQPRTGKLDNEVKEFIAAVTKLAVAASPGGKASAGQPGLVWHGSFLIRRSNRKQLESALKKYASIWKDTRRIDCSGPWPPYSFVEEHVH